MFRLHLIIYLLVLTYWFGGEPSTTHLDVRYVQEKFKEECHCIANIEVRFDELKDLPDGVAAICERNFLVKPYIRVNPEYFDVLNDNEKESLLYHELGHCYLFRDHDYRLLPNSIFPRSLMYPVHFDYPPRMRSYYIKELFSS